MSVAYRTVQWNPFKRRYDVVVAVGALMYISIFIAATYLPRADDARPALPVVLIRATATLAFVLLHVILLIGPLARIDRRFLPLLYNRRHLGVMTFLIALAHGLLVLGYYHGFGAISAVTSLLSSNTQYRSISAFPFETLGLIALLILFLMAATSHDFWLKTLSPGAWKFLHMGVYVAYVLLVLHVALGALMSERSAAYTGLVGSGALLVTTLHLVSGWRECRIDRHASEAEHGWVDVPSPESIGDGRARRVVLPDGSRVAVFRQGECLHAISDVCAHQNGPLSEGRIVDGCVTCPWHGYQYRASDGCAPPPFTERLPTYVLRRHEGCVQLRVMAQADGTPTALPLIEIEESAHVR
ncbi:MAG: ferric reductase-like transmembrane domain-containing protein [Tepidisphaeraceae bacterium]